MTRESLAEIISAAKEGNTKAFNDFFTTLSRECKSKLLAFVSTKTEAEEAFAETMYKFWKKFVVDEKPLPKSNVKGYIFTMAKYYCIDQQNKNKKLTFVDDISKTIQQNASGKDDFPTTPFEEEENLELKYEEALKKGIKILSERCRKIFEFILENGSDKPRDLWQPLGYKNVGTFRTVKSECQKELKLIVVRELSE